MTLRRLVLPLALLLSIGCKRAPSDSSAPEPLGSAPAAVDTATPEPKPFSVDDMKLPTLPEVAIPADNPQSTAKIDLGQRLFFDTKLSGDGKLACYSCHQNEHGNGGETPLAIGAYGKTLPRHSPTIWNVAFLPKLYWDGRADSLEAQALGAWTGGNLGVGKENAEKKAKEIAALPEYKARFAAAFPGQAIGSDLVIKALAAYERTLVCRDTAYDRYAKGDKTALSVEQKAGLGLFMGKALCTACHAPPFFTTASLGQGAFFNVGVGTKDVPEADVDVGRMQVTQQPQDWAAFKPPTLRHVSKSAPYFHDGSVKTLREAVTFMAKGGQDNKNKSALMADRGLSEGEIDQLVLFLGALECGGKLTPPAGP
jgi:cytochrome c peroxidase